MYSQVDANKRKTVLLIFSFMLIIGALGFIFSEAYGTPGMFYAVLGFSVVYAFFGYYFSSKIALGLTGAKPISKDQNPRLFRIVENTSITAGLPMPDVYIIDDPAPNAFATGRDPNHAAVAATTGILDLLDDSELEGVMAHEMSHVGNYDIRVMGIVIVLVTIISLITDMFLRMTWFGGGRDSDNNGSAGAIFAVVGIVAAVLAPLIAAMLRLAVSRKREYLADASGVLLTRYPEGLASALEKIGAYSRPMRRANSSTAHLFISNPLKDKQGGDKKGFAHLFSTHPPISERVKLLRNMDLN